MNERIKELALQATSPPHRSQGYGGEPTHIYPGTLDPEKFAELIVKECARVAKQTDSYDDDVYKSGRTWAGIDILKHFGVE